MFAVAYDLGITPHQVLATFRYDAPYLFLGSAFIAVGLISGAFSAVRRKADTLLIYFALFATVYGLRLWIQAEIVKLMFDDSVFYLRFREGINYIVPVPAMLFLNATGGLTRLGKSAGYLLVVVGSILAVATFAFGPAPWFHTANNVAVILALTALILQVVIRSRVDRDIAVIRRGLLVFAATALVDNAGGMLRWRWRIEPYGFVALLAALGYVAARHALARDQQLGEIQKELEVARRIQLSILPGEFPSSPSFRVAARYVPMTSVAGDFYDFIVAGDKCAGLLIADVSGHGVPAALIASMVKLAATSQRDHAADPSSLLAGMNAALCGNTQSQFVTAAYVHLDAESRELRYSAAGHPPMLLLRGGNVQAVTENGLMLAAFDFATYSTMAQRLEQGDRLLLYTDGIIEAGNRKGEFFGHDALCALLRDTASLSASDAADRVIASVQKWSAAQDDDLTVLVCDYVGS
jgi:phosphoserine phosphatase RsbU/P